MPCRDDYGDREYANELGRRLDIVTDLLCDLCTRLETTGQANYINISTKLSIWWLNHKEMDRIRRLNEQLNENKEQLRRNAISKLSVEERQALGL